MQTNRLNGHSTPYVDTNPHTPFRPTLLVTRADYWWAVRVAFLIGTALGTVLTHYII